MVKLNISEQQSPSDFGIEKSPDQFGQSRGSMLEGGQSSRRNDDSVKAILKQMALKLDASNRKSELAEEQLSVINK